jgi:hypothetical protein
MFDLSLRLLRLLLLLSVCCIGLSGAWDVLSNPITDAHIHLLDPEVMTSA